MSERAGVSVSINEYKNNTKENNILKILELSAKWFEDNLNNESNTSCIEYLKKRKLSKDTINFFRLGYSYNPKISLYKFLKSNSFEDEELIKSNVIKYDKNNNIKDFFYKRLMFPITNLQGKVVGFGGRVLDNTNPKYINSSESSFFQKRYLLYNLKSAKEIARKKNNLLICEGYMDVISLYQNGIKSVVAPLGTALTTDQISLAWRYSKKPTIMFDGDNAGIRASYKAALMSLPLLAPNRFLQFIVLPHNLDPDNYLDSFSFSELIDLLKKPTPLIDFIFEQSSSSLSLENTDDKIMYDKYLDDIVSSIKDKKIQYFYKNAFKNLFFKKLKFKNKSNISTPNNTSPSSLLNKQILSFIAAILNHKKIKNEILDILKEANFLNFKQKELIKYLENANFDEQSTEKIVNNCTDLECKKILNDSLENKITQLFPFSSKKYDYQKVTLEIKDSVKNLNTRLLNLKKINKSLDTFVKNSNTLNWNELQSINNEITNDD